MRRIQATGLALATAIVTVAVLLPQPAQAERRAPAAAASAQTVRAFQAWARRRVGMRQFRALKNIWAHESGWNRFARNPNSGAYGIPQALPPGKLGAAGSDWTWNGYTQMRWGLRYIESHYGSPTRAWRFWQAHYWY